jgi:hypothetical protein
MHATRGSPALAAAVLGIALATTSAADPLPAIDAAAIAKRVVGSLQPSPGETAVLVFDPAYYPELTQAFAVELEKAGAHPVLALAESPPEVLGPLFADPAAARKREDAFVALLEPVFRKAALFFWMPVRLPFPGRALERLVDLSAVRGVHFHWILPIEGKTLVEIGAASRLYEKAILETDYAALSKEQDRLIAALRGKELRVTTPAGTDLRLRVPADAWFHKNDGALPPERARAGRGARDREMEFPAGALRLIPDPAATEGTLLVPRMSVPRAGPDAGDVTNARFEFHGGRVVSSSASGNEAGLRRILESIGGDVDKVGELVIGTNPLLAGRLPGGELPYFGYGAGYVRISLGDNWESGGPLRTKTRDNLWLFLEGATLTAGPAVVVREGALVK